MSAIYVLLEELEIVKAESRAEISHHLTDCSRINSLTLATLEA
jgi:hypothetical protein